MKILSIGNSFSQDAQPIKIPPFEDFDPSLLMEIQRIVNGIKENDYV